MDLQLSGRIAVVTGASKGIGLAVTRSLIEEGASVVAAFPEDESGVGRTRPVTTSSTSPPT